jgi:hypothetical protein
LAGADRWSDRQKKNSTKCGTYFQANANTIKILARELPQLLDKLWYGENDSLFSQMMQLKSRLGFGLLRPMFGYLRVIEELPEKGGFRHAVKDHILARLREEAKDVLLDSIRDPAVTIKFNETNYEKLDKDAVNKLLERRDKVKLSLLTENVSTNLSEKHRQDKHNQELKLSIKSHTERLQALGYTISMEPDFDINLLRSIRHNRPGIWYSYGERTKVHHYLFQMRLHSFVASLNTSSDTVRKNDTLLLIERCLGTGPDDIFTDKAFWESGKK